MGLNSNLSKKTLGALDKSIGLFGLFLILLYSELKNLKMGGHIY